MSILTSPELLIGASVALLLSWLARVTGLSSRLGGTAAVVAASLGLLFSGSATVPVIGSVAGLWLGGLIWGRAKWLGWIVIAVSAAALGVAEAFPARPLFQVAFVGYVMLAGFLLRDFEGRRGSAGAFFAITALGVFLTVPSPNEAVAVLGGSAAFLVLPRIGGTASSSLIGLLAWASVIGGIERTGSVVGALACIGLLLVEPLSYRLSRTWPRLLIGPPVLSRRLLIAVHALSVMICSRIAGFQEKSEPALILAVLGLASAWLLLTDLLPGSDMAEDGPG